MAPTASAGEFPALARAKQRFLARQAAARAQQPLRHAASSAREKLRALGCDLDAELSALSSDVDAIHAEIARAHHETARELVAAAASFVLSGSAGSGRDAIPPEHADAEARRLDAPTAAPASTPAETSEPEERRLSARSRQHAAPQRSRVAALALRAVHALLLQRFARRVLYARLYPSGELQFARAQQLRRRAAAARAWRRWRSLVEHRKRRRATFAAAARRLSADRARGASVSAAERVRESDGTFAAAKRFHETKLLWRVLRGWLLAMAAAAAAPPPARTH